MSRSLMSGRPRLLHSCRQEANTSFSSRGKTLGRDRREGPGGQAGAARTGGCRAETRGWGCHALSSSPESCELGRCSTTRRHPAPSHHRTIIRGVDGAAGGRGSAGRAQSARKWEGQPPALSELRSGCWAPPAGARRSQVSVLTRTIGEGRLRVGALPTGPSAAPSSPNHGHLGRGDSEPGQTAAPWFPSAALETYSPHSGNVTGIRGFRESSA